MDFLQSLDPLLRVLWYIAIPVSLFFLIQSVMTFIGADASDGTEADFDGDLGHSEAPFQLFSLRNLINFLLGFSWTGISLYDLIESKLILLALAFVVGVSFVALFFLIIRQVQKLAEDNSFRISSTLNKTAEVYLTIPERKKGKGKITLTVNGSYRELDAMTENDRIESGSVVRIVKIEQGSMPIVETL